MKKKIYSQPTMNVVYMQNRQQLMNASSVQTNSESNDVDLIYEPEGGNQGVAW